MTTRVTTCAGNGAIMVLAAFLWSGQLVQVAEAQPLVTLQPRIDQIQLEGTNVLITIQAPRGVKKITLQGSSRLGTGAWTPRAVSRLDGSGGKVVIRLPRSPELEIVRVRGDETEPLPAIFYQGTNLFPGVPITGNVNPGLTFLAPNSSASGAVTDSGASATPVTRDVVESDIWRIEDDVLYFFNQYRGLQVIDIAQPDSPVLLGTLSLPASGEQMYLLPGKRAALLARNGCGYSPEGGGQVMIVDVADGTPRIVQTLPVAGEIQESRLVGAALYVMTQTYRPVSGSRDGAWEWGTGIYAFDLSAPDAAVARPSLFFSGYGNVLTATDEFLFVSVADNSGASVVHCIDISNPDGTLQKSGAIPVAGRVPDKFKMHLNGDVFTVISEKWGAEIVNGSARWGTVTKLETFSLANPASPAKLGQLELGNGEQLHATRFDGDRVYVVTFFRVDPLWVVDLSDPRRPAIKGELKVPGWSTYIQPLGDRLLTIGIDNTNGWRVAVSLFDVHDPAAPALLSKVPLGENSSWSEANTDEKAFGFLPDAGLLLVPFSSYSTNNQEGVQLIDFNSQSLAKRGFISHDVQARRSTLHRDRILSLSGRELLTVDASDRDKPIVRSETELAWPVNKVFVQGDYVLEVETSSAWETTQPRVRVARAASPEQIVQSVGLTNLPIAGAALQDGLLYLLQGKSTYSAPIVFAEDKGTSQIGTNRTELLCTILDASKLPALEILSSAALDTGDSFNGSAAAVWPKPGLLVWVTQQANYWRGFLPVIDFIGGVSLAPALTFPGLWYPYGGGGESKLFAVDASDPKAAQFVSEVSLTQTNGWASFSKPFAAGGLVYLSQQTSETIISGTNLFLITNTVPVLTTNVVWVTNYIKTPDSRMETNYNTASEIKVTAVASRLGARLLSSGAGSVLIAGAFHSVAVTADGQVWTWGDNSHGQLGRAGVSPESAPMTVTGLADVRAVAAGDFHNLALRTDGSVWSWGDDALGQLGDGFGPADPNLPPMPETGSSSPVRVLELENVLAIGAGYWHSLAATADGSVWAWGDNRAGQLGDGSFENQSQPVRLPQLRDVIQISGGKVHSLALQRGGAVWSWGANDHGQLGDGSAGRSTPGAIPGLNDVVALSAGHAHNLALRKDGTVWSWGLNRSGQLGDGTTTDRSTPQIVPELSNVVSVACGESHSLALRGDGSVWAWGQAKDGQVGPVELDALRPVLVGEVSPLSVVAAGANHSLGASPDGEIVYGWGENSYGQLGNGSQIARTNTLIETNIVAVVTWTESKDVVRRTNVVRTLQPTVMTVEQPEYLTRQLAYLDVIDYEAAAHPVLRPPVTAPGALQGLSHEGALLYFTGPSLDASAALDGSEWLHACAYDGVRCYLVDSHALPKAWPHAVLVHDSRVYITRPAVDKAAGPALEVWSVSDGGKFAKLSERGLKSNGSLLQRVSDLLIVQEDSGLELLDLNKPAELPEAGAAEAVGCYGWNLDSASGSLQDGLWLPLDLYGVYRVPTRN